ncbi:hypothetical protein [Burkholderia ambifaria]|uniref:hypothetical protein n=1 Tax=Burkholderia ambifaria TaxID=152480 RepID=UPI000F8056F0|nr:hypothetical protein [Burkholderia ambifaria]
MNPLKNVPDKLNRQSLAGKLYVLGNAALVIVMGVLVLIPWLGHPGLTVIAAGPLLLFMAGFLIWGVPKLLAFSRSQFGTMPVVVVSALLAPISLGFSRLFVGALLQLPAQSFDVTVALFSVLFIPIGWGVVVGVILLLACLVLIFGTMTSAHIRPIVGIFALNPAGWLARALGRVEATERTISNHAAGAFVVAIAILLLSGFYAATILNPTGARLAAYLFDFSLADKYPGIQPGQRIRLLDNGYVAYAERHGFDVQFDVKPLALPDKPK